MNKEALEEKLWQYIVEYNPDLLLKLQEDHIASDYLDKKVKSIQPVLSRLTADGAPGYIIEEISMEMLTRDLRPSRFAYIRNILREEFAGYFLYMQETGQLTYEIVNLIGECNRTFDTFAFSEERKEDKELRQRIAGIIDHYIACG